jgi:hypothetical protein
METKTIHFPFAGIDVSGPFYRQPARHVGPGKSDYARSTPEGVNVRGYGANGRKRGGSRPGFSRYINARVNGEWVVQDLNVLVVVNSEAVG